MGEYDHLIPPEASKPFNDVIASDDTRTIEFSTGHIGLSVSRRPTLTSGPRSPSGTPSAARDEEVDIEVESPEAAEDDAVDQSELTDIDVDATDDVDADATEDDATDEPADVDSVSGIGPTYAERLHDAGIHASRTCRVRRGRPGRHRETTESRRPDWLDH